MPEKLNIREPEDIINNIPDLVVSIDAQGVITYINAASILFFNKKPGQLTGLNLDTLFGEQGLDFPDENSIQRVFETRQAEIIEGELQIKDNEIRNIEIRIMPEPLESQSEPHLILMIRDVTLRKGAEQNIIRARRKAEERDQLKSAFLANMSHEIRTPLNAIVGFSQIILDEDITREEQERFYDYINQNSNQLISLVNDIIDLSKLECNQLVIRETAANLNQVMEEMDVLAEHEKKIREKEYLLILRDLDQLDDVENILIDPYRLKQVLTNLLVNAIKFTPRGYIQFGYRLRDSQTLLFFVRDSGIGIPANKQAEVFEYFHQLENNLNRTNTGTGLGLAICKRLVTLMKGTIWLQSESGKGTCFYFTLPFQKA